MPKKRQITKRPPKVRIAKPSGRPYQIRYFCPNEKREVRISVGSRDWEEAEDLQREIIAKLTLNIEINRNKEIRGAATDWGTFREQYSKLHLMSLRDKSAQDAESRLDIAEKIIKPKTLGEMADPAKLQTLQARLIAGAHSRKGKPRSPHTVRGHMKSVIAALNWAYRQNWIPDAPRVPKLKVPKSAVMKGRPISEIEFGELLDAVEAEVGSEVADSWKYLLRGLWESALRIEEIMNVSWDLPGTIRPVWIEGQHPILKIPASMQKNDTEEDIPLLPGFECLLFETSKSDRTGWVFDPQSLQLKLGRHVRRERLGSDWVGKVISRIGEKAGIIVKEENPKTGQAAKYVSAHDLRRSCGEHLRNAGVPPLLVTRIMRHSSWEVTQRHYAPGNIQREAEAIRQHLGGGKEPETSSSAATSQQDGESKSA